MNLYKVAVFVLCLSYSSNASSLIEESKAIDSKPDHVEIDIKGLEEAIESDVEPVSGIVADIRNKALSISQKINIFKTKYPQFEYGITAIRNLYANIDNPDILRERINPTIPLRTIVFGAEILTGTACEILKCLSMLGIVHDASTPDASASEAYSSQWYGPVLSGLYAIKAGLWGLDSYLLNKAKKSQKTILSSLQSDPKLRDQVHSIETDIKHVKANELYEITDDLMTLLDGAELEYYNQKLLDRLQTIKTSSSNVEKFKKITNIGGKVLSFITGGISGILVSTLGKEAIPSCAITLTSCGIDSIFDSIATTTSSKPIVQKYTSICEIIYICDYFANELLSTTSLSSGSDHD